MFFRVTNDWSILSRGHKITWTIEYLQSTVHVFGEVVGVLDVNQSKHSAGLRLESMCLLLWGNTNSEPLRINTEIWNKYFWWTHFISLQSAQCFFMHMKLPFMSYSSLFYYYYPVRGTDQVNEACDATFWESKLWCWLKPGINLDKVPLVPPKF